MASKFKSLNIIMSIIIIFFIIYILFFFDDSDSDITDIDNINPTIIPSQTTSQTQSESTPDVSSSVGTITTPGVTPSAGTITTPIITPSAGTIITPGVSSSEDIVILPTPAVTLSSVPTPAVTLSPVPTPAVTLSPQQILEIEERNIYEMWERGELDQILNNIADSHPSSNKFGTGRPAEYSNYFYSRWFKGNEYKWYPILKTNIDDVCDYTKSFCNDGGSDNHEKYCRSDPNLEDGLSICKIPKNESCFDISLEKQKPFYNCKEIFDSIPIDGNVYQGYIYKGDTKEFINPYTLETYTELPDYEADNMEDSVIKEYRLRNNSRYFSSTGEFISDMSLNSLQCSTHTCKDKNESDCTDSCEWNTRKYGCEEKCSYYDKEDDCNNMDLCHWDFYGEKCKTHVGTFNNLIIKFDPEMLDNTDYKDKLWIDFKSMSDIEVPDNLKEFEFHNKSSHKIVYDAYNNGKISFYNNVLDQFNKFGFKRYENLNSDVYNILYNRRFTIEDLLGYMKWQNPDGNINSPVFGFKFFGDPSFRFFKFFTNSFSDEICPGYTNYPHWA